MKSSSLSIAARFPGQVCGLFFLAGAVAAAPTQGQPGLTREAISRSVAPAFAGRAGEIGSAGGFAGFHVAPGCSLTDSGPVYDYLVQNIAIDERGQPTAGDPLNGGRQRDVRAGEALSYVMTDYPRTGETASASSRQHRYSVPFGEGRDEHGTPYPIILGWRDLPPDLASTEFGTLGPRDIASMVGIFPDYANYMGAYIPKKEGYVVSLGPGYADAAAVGMGRFSHALYPARVPPLGSLWYATVLQKTYSIGRSAKVDTFPAHGGNLLVPQLTVGKRLMYAYGTRGKKTRPLDSIVVVLAYNNVNSLGDAPEIENRSTQTERIYLTRELGYATRWEAWAREDSKQKDVLQAARRAYDYDDCGLPANLAGRVSDHFILGPVVEDKDRHVYQQEQTVIDPKTGRSETHQWYLIGCHDYTNLQPTQPFDPATQVNGHALGDNYGKLFGISPALPNSP